MVQSTHLSHVMLVSEIRKVAVVDGQRFMGGSTLYAWVFIQKYTLENYQTFPSKIILRYR